MTAQFVKRHTELPAGLVAQRSIEPPEGGWKPSTIYIVDVAMNEFNPIFRALFFSGFLDDNGQPSGYNGLLSSVPDGLNEIHEIYYLRVLGEVDMNPDGAKLI